MDDMDQPTDRIALVAQPNQRAHLIFGSLEAISAIALASVLALLFAPPVTTPSTWAVLGLTALVLGRRLLADYWFSRSEIAGQTALASYRARFSQQVIHALPRETSGSIGALAIEGTEPMAARLGRFPTIRLLSVIQPLLVLSVIAYIHWPVAAGILITVPLIPLLMIVIGMGAKSASQKQVDSLTRLGAHYTDRVRGLETLWLMGHSQAVSEEIESAADRLRRSTMKVLKLAFLTSAVLEFFSALSIALLAVYVGLTLLNLITPLFGLPISPVDGLCLLVLAPEFYNPIRRLMAAWHDASEAKSADDKVHEILTSDTQGHIEPATRPAQHPTALFELSQYSVGVGADRVLITPFDLAIEPHQITAIFGPSGSGKTQFLNSLLTGQGRLAGQLYFDGQPIDTLTEVRESVAWMGQHQWFDEGTVYEALTYGRNDLPEQACIEALASVGLLSQLGDRPLERSLGARGQGLSGGQLRRLGLARALLAKPALMLLDEPTAHLDADAADQIAELIMNLPVAALLITHDDRFARLATRYRLHEGALESLS